MSNDNVMNKLYLNQKQEDVIKNMSQYIEKLEQLICKAAPLAWSTGHYMSEAAQWEKDAMELLKGDMRWT